jgi:hypothetical protein
MSQVILIRVNILYCILYILYIPCRRSKANSNLEDRFADPASNALDLFSALLYLLNMTFVMQISKTRFLSLCFGNSQQGFRYMGNITYYTVHYS